MKLTALKKKLVNGIGSTVLGFVLIYSAFIITIASFQLFEVYNSHVRTQMLIDIMTDGATVHGQIPKGVKTDKVKEKAQELFDQNESLGITSSLSPQITVNLSQVRTKKVQVREKVQNIPVTDTDVSLHLDADVKTNLSAASILDAPSSWRAAHSVNVLAMSMVPDQIPIKAEDQEIMDEVLNRLGPNSISRKILEKAFTYYGWAYSREHRWEEGARDCSSFILSAFEETDYFLQELNAEGVNNAYSQTMWRDANEAKRLKLVEEYPFDANCLRPGDVLFFETPWGKEEKRENNIGAMAIFLGEFDGKFKIIHANEPMGGVGISDLYGTMEDDEERIIAYMKVARGMGEVDENGIPIAPYCNQCLGLWNQELGRWTHTDWPYQPYNERNAAPYPANLMWQGCGITCGSMVMSYLTGIEELNPIDIASYDDAIKNDMIPYANERLGTNIASDHGVSWQEVIDALTDGHMAIILVGNHAHIPEIAPYRGQDTWASTSGHFIVLLGIMPDGTIAVHDPARAGASYWYQEQKVTFPPQWIEPAFLGSGSTIIYTDGR